MVEPLDSHHHITAAPLPHVLDPANIRKIEVFGWVGHENRTVTDLSIKIPALITRDNLNKTKQLRSPSCANGLGRTRFLINKNKDMFCQPIITFLTRGFPLAPIASLASYHALIGSECCLRFSWLDRRK